jgi:PIN domain nuclease of toxin-antitoxin system
MVAYVLYSSAILRYIDNEPGSDRIWAILASCVANRSKIYISAIQWGEVAGKLRERLGPASGTSVLTSFLPSEAEVVPATGQRAIRAATLRVDRNLAYADGFAMDLALDSADRVLVTADYGFKAVEDLAKIEFLPTK